MQQPQQLRPMGIGRILDSSFQLYRTHFTTLAIIMLALYGPVSLASIGLAGEGVSTYYGLMDSLQNGNFDQYIETTAAEDTMIGAGEVISIILGLLLTLILGPASMAAIVHLVQAHVRGEEIPGAGELLKRGFRRFWPLTGTTLLYFFIMFVMYMVIAVGAVSVFAILISLVLSGTGGLSGGATILIFLGFLALLLLVTFLGIRWAFYLPHVALGESGTGIGSSWRLTKGNFWRLFLLFIVLFIILSIFTSVISLGTEALFGGGTFAYIVDSLVSILLGSLWVLPYAIAFFDLRVRREGFGLDQLLNNADPHAGQTPPAPPASWGGGIQGGRGAGDAEFKQDSRNEGVDGGEQTGNGGESGGPEGGSRP